MKFHTGCKINLGLHILGKRTDNYHELHSLFCPLKEPSDILDIEIIKHPEITVKCDNKFVDPTNNSLTKTYYIFKQNASDIKGVEINLEKIIPPGSGLGGASADSACLLKFLNSQIKNPLDNKKLSEIALSIGADVPFFLYNKPAMVKGIGEKIFPINYNFSNIMLIVIIPEVHVSTAWAFTNYLTKNAHKDIGTFFSDALDDELKYWNIVNDLEDTVFNKYLELKTIKLELLEHGVDIACMSGTGSAIFGLCKNSQKKAQNIANKMRLKYKRTYLMNLENNGM